MAERREDAAESERRRWHVLRRLERWLETPMVVLGFLWLLLLVVELMRGLTPALEIAGTAIWLVFLVEFAVRLAIAPRRTDFLKANWLALVALVVPALRLLRLARAFALLRTLRFTRGLRLVRIVTSLNRGMRSLAGSLGRRGFGYVVGLTVLVTLVGSAGMWAFESVRSGGGLRSYGEALWWTAMVITTLGSEYWPQTPEGRVLCVILAVYALAVFGYVAATLASYFVGQDAQRDIAAGAAVRELRDDIARLRSDIRALRDARDTVTRGE